MTRAEAEAKIYDLMLQIRAAYKTYNPDGDYLTLYFLGESVAFHNAYHTEDSNRPIDFWRGAQ